MPLRRARSSSLTAGWFGRDGLPILEMGRRLAISGSLADVDDIFHLSLDEIKQAFAGSDFQDLVKERPKPHNGIAYLVNVVVVVLSDYRRDV